MYVRVYISAYEYLLVSLHARYECIFLFGTFDLGRKLDERPRLPHEKKSSLPALRDGLKIQVGKSLKSLMLEP